MGRESRILAYVVGGEPNAQSRMGVDTRLECFPAPLKYKIGPSGELTKEPIDPLAADPRPTGDGDQNAKLKIIAGLLGVGLDDLKRRESKAARRRVKFRFALGAAAVCLVVASAIGGRSAWDSAREAQRQQSQAILLASVPLEPELAVPRLLEALPRSLQRLDRPYVPEVGAQLALALDKSRDALWLKPTNSGNVTTLRFAADTPVLLTSSESGGTSAIDLLDIPGGAKRFERKFDNPLYDVNVAADGRQIVAAERASPARLHLIRVPVGSSESLRDTSMWLPGTPENSSRTNAMVMTPDGVVALAFGGFGDPQTGFASVDMATGGITDLKFFLSCLLPTIQFSPNGGAALVWCDEHVEFWQLGRELRGIMLQGSLSLPSRVLSAFSPDQKYLAVGPNDDGNIVIYRTSDGALRRQL